MAKPARKRLMREYKDMIKNPPPHIVAAPLLSNILECHYCIYGLEESPYKGGYYHGKLIFPEGYPFKPPSIMMLTPSGRFRVATRLCLSMSDYHPDQWNPAWSIESILKGLLSFMLENTATAGSITTSSFEKRRLASESGAFNLKSATFVEIFPDLAERITTDLASRQPPSDTAAADDAAKSGAASGPGEDQTKELGNSWAANMMLLGALFAFFMLVSHIVEESGEL